MQIRYVYFDRLTEDFVRLTDELDREFSDKNGAAQAQYDGFNRLEGIADVVIAYDGETPVACGSIKRHDESSYEVKRVYVRKQFRGRGISKGIMKELERVARERGVSRLILETSRTFLEAVCLYKSLGYLETENYGQYRGMELSVCMEKILARD